MRETVEDVLRGMIAKQAHLDPSVITPESVLSELGVTSLDLVEIIMTIEDKYDVTIPVDAVEAWNSYKTVASLIELGHSLGLEGHRSGT
jgi:acyl carrier protein